MAEFLARRWLAGLALAALACACAPVPIRAVPVRLPDLVGQRVELAGEFHGPAKLGDYIDVAGQAIHLPGARLPAGGIAYGTRVVVSGRLDHDDGIVSDCRTDPACVATVPPHYFIGDADVRRE